MLQLVASPLARVAIIAAAVAAFGLTCWLKGAAHAERRFEAIRAAEQAETLATVQRLAREAAEIDAITMNISTTVRERAKVVTREVPVYVTREADARCTVPVGLERLWHIDLQALPDTATAGSGNDAASRLALSDVARGVVEAKERFALNRATAEACQAWARSVRAAP